METKLRSLQEQKVLIVTKPRPQPLGVFTFLTVYISVPSEISFYPFPHLLSISKLSTIVPLTRKELLGLASNEPSLDSSCYLRVFRYSQHLLLYYLFACLFAYLSLFTLCSLVFCLPACPYEGAGVPWNWSCRRL